MNPRKANQSETRFILDIGSSFSSLNACPVHKYIYKLMYKNSYIRIHICYKDFHQNLASERMGLSNNQVRYFGWIYEKGEAVWMVN